MEVTRIRLFLLCTKLTKPVDFYDVIGAVAIKLVRNRITPAGGRHQRRLVVYTQNSSGRPTKCTPLSDRFGQIGYHYKLQDSAKMCAQY